MLHGVNAAGLSAFNPVERRMAPLSHDLAGIILPHDHFGNHLDSSGKTINQELEEINFQKAAEIVSEVWEKTVIDGYPVDCRAVPVGNSHEPTEPDPVWVAKHCQQSRYCLQIVKCQDESCCSPFETSWLSIIPDRFIPFPAIYEYSNNGNVPVEPSNYFQNLTKPTTFAPLTHRLLVKAIPEEGSIYTTVPFDLYCPSLKEMLDKGICDKCGKYWPSEAAMKRHKKAHNKRTEQPIEDDNEERYQADTNEKENQEDFTERMPVLDNIFDLFKSPFTEE